MAVKAGNQLAIDETLVEDDDLEEQLERREELKAQIADLRRTVQPITDGIVAKCEGRFDKLEAGTVLRIGRFRIERKESAPRSVSFETEAKLRIAITPDADA